MQNPISLPPDNEPQPDIALLRPEFWQRKDVPTAGDVLLVIEVADTTLARDQGVKIPLYARHGTPESWLFDLESEQTTIYRDPGAQGYRTVISPARDATVSPIAKPEIRILAAEIWPAK